MLVYFLLPLPLSDDGISVRSGLGSRFLRDEKRFATDVLLLLNMVCFSLQWLSRDMLTLWGAKVSCRRLLLPEACTS